MITRIKNSFLIFTLVFSLGLISILSIKISIDSPYFVLEYYYNLNDASINQSSNKAIEQSVMENNYSNNENYDYTPVKVSSDFPTMYASFDPLFDTGTYAMFLSGFLFEDALLEYSELEKENFIVYIDDGSMTFTDDDPINDPKSKYITSIAISEIYSGFVAGFLSGIYLTTTYDNPEEWIAGAWGGGTFPSVILFLSGFEYGIQFFIETFDGIITGVDQMELVYPFGNDDDKPEKKWYTNSFSTDGSGTVATDNLVKKGANVLYPVAGSQTKEALDYILATGDDAKVIGVDTDASLLYKNSEDILFSTVKDFDDPIEENVFCFYDNDNDDDISECLKEEEVYESEVLFNDNDSSSMDTLLFDFIQKYELEEIIILEMGEIPSDITVATIEYLKTTTTYIDLLDTGSSDTFVY